jgi:hypothetical protein
VIIEKHSVIRRGKDNTPCNEILRWRPRKILWARCAFSHRHIARGSHEFRGLCVDHVGLVHVKAVHIHAVMGRASNVAFMPISSISGGSFAGTRRAIFDRCLKSNRWWFDIQGIFANWMWTLQWTPIGRMPSESQVPTASSQYTQGDGRQNRDAQAHSPSTAGVAGCGRLVLR